MGRTKRQRRGALGLMIAAMTAVAPATTAAASIGVIADSGTARAGTHTVTATCRGVAATTTAPGRPTTFVVEGDAWASPPHLALRTSITCSVRDAWTGVEYGRVHGSAPGPHAHAVGTVVAPYYANTKICTSAESFFIDGTWVMRDFC